MMNEKWYRMTDDEDYYIPRIKFPKYFIEKMSKNKMTFNTCVDKKLLKEFNIKIEENIKDKPRLIELFLKAYINDPDGVENFLKSKQKK